MIKYTIEQLREYYKDKSKSLPIACPICGKAYSYKGLWTHIDRSHNESKQYCQGNNGCYNKPEYKKALCQSLNKHYSKLLGGFKEFEVECSKCHKKFKVLEREFSFPIKNKYYCSNSCSHSHVLSDETKHKLSVKSSLHYKYPRHNICKFCGKETKAWKVKFCSKECLKNWKRRYMSEFRKYRLDCQFNFNLKDYPEEFDFLLIKKYGWYKASNHGNNLKGVSRDHRYSIYDGFRNHIDPRIISHPANCELMQQNKNSSKYKKSSITLEELLERIKKWDEKYKTLDY